MTVDHIPKAVLVSLRNIPHQTYYVDIIIW